MSGTFEGDFVSATLDEIALEGLDGITLDTLWYRLSERPKFPLGIDDDSKRFIWDFIAIHPELEFFELPEPRPSFPLKNNKQEPDLDTSELDNNEGPGDSSELDIYPYHPIDDNGIRGSCGTYTTRKNITSQVRNNSGEALVTFIEALKLWGQKLAIVASPSTRYQALVGLECNPHVTLSLKQYCMLEKIGRSRYDGEISKPKLKPGLVNEDPKSAFYLRKYLLKEKLITKQPFTFNNGGSLLHLTRFYTEQKSEIAELHEKTIAYLESQPNKKETCNKLREVLGCDTYLFKKMYSRSYNGALKVYALSYREFYPDAPDKEALTLSGKEKDLKIIELVKLKKENELDKEDEEEENEPQILHHNPKIYLKDHHGKIFKIAYDTLEAAGPNGLTIKSLAARLGVHRLEARQLTRNLESKGLVEKHMMDRGRQKVTHFIAKHLAQESKDYKVLLEGINKFSENVEIMKPSSEISAESPKSSHKSITSAIKTALDKKTKDALLVTSRMIKRTNMILELVKRNKVIDDVFKIHKTLIKAEEEEGLKTKVDKRSLHRILNKLQNDGLIKSLTTVLRSGKAKKVLRIICEPNLSVDDPIILNTLEQAKLTFFGVPLKSPKSKLDRTAALPKPTELDLLSGGDIKSEEKLKINYKVNKIYGVESKFGKMKVLYTFLFYLIYDYAGRDDAPQAEEGNHPKMYHPESQDWRLFVPPLPSNPDCPKGWVYLRDVLLCMPLSIFVNLVYFYFTIDGLDTFLADPVKKHYLIKHLPRDILGPLLIKRNYIHHIHMVLTRLAYCGMLTFGPQKFKERDYTFFFLHRKLSIKNTTTSQPSYLHITPDLPYPIVTYTLDTTKDAEDYWGELESICLTTPLGFYNTAQGQKLEIIQADRKPDLIEASQIKSIDSVVDEGFIPGDGLGAGGLDSSLFSHLVRNWHPSNDAKKGNTFLANKTKRLGKLNDDLGPKKKRLRLAEEPIFKNKSIRVTQVPNMTKAQKRKITCETKKLPSKRKKPDVIVRTVRKRIRHERSKKPHYDEIDLEALKKMNRLRVEWTTQEDTFLLLCKVASLFLLPHSRSLIVPFTVVRDILNKYLPELTKNKTSRACQRRLYYILKNPSTWINVSAFLGEALQDTNLLSKFHHKERVPLTQEEIWKQRFESVFDELFNKFQLLSGIEATIPSISDSIDDIYANYNVIVALRDRDQSSHTSKPQTIYDIRKGVLHALIFSAVNTLHDKANWSFIFYQLYESFKNEYPNIQNEVEKFLSVNRIIAKRKEINKRNPFLPYHLSQSFEMFLKSKYDFKIHDEAYNYIRFLETQNEGKPIKINMNILACQVAALSSLLISDFLEFSIIPPTFYPDNLQQPKPKSPSHSRHAKYVLNYQKENVSKNMESQLCTVLQPSVIHVNFKSSYINKSLHTRESLYEKLINKQRAVLPLEIGDVETEKLLQDNFSSEEIEAIRPLYNLICESKEFGVSLEDIYDKFPNEYSEMRVKLKILLDKHIVIRVGLDTFKYVDQQYAHPWIISSYVIPKEERLRVSEICRSLVRKKEDLPQDMLDCHHLHSSTWNRVKFVLRAWKKPDGSLNRAALKKILVSVLNYVIYSACISQENICNRYAASYQPVQILEVLEILEELKAIRSIMILQRGTPSFKSRPIQYEYTTTTNPKLKVFYESELDSMIKLGHFLDHLIIKH